MKNTQITVILTVSRRQSFSTETIYKFLGLINTETSLLPTLATNVVMKSFSPPNITLYDYLNV